MEEWPRLGNLSESEEIRLLLDFTLVAWRPGGPEGSEVIYALAIIRHLNALGPASSISMVI